MNKQDSKKDLEILIEDLRTKIVLGLRQAKTIEHYQILDDALQRYLLLTEEYQRVAQ